MRDMIDADSAEEIVRILKMVEQGATALGNAIKEDKLTNVAIQTEAARIFLRQAVERLGELRPVMLETPPSQ